MDVDLEDLAVVEWMLQSVLTGDLLGGFVDLVVLIRLLGKGCF